MIVLFRNDAEYTSFIYNSETMSEVLFEKEIENVILRIINKIHVSTKLNRIFNMPGKEIWYRFYLDYISIPKEEENIFIFMEGNALALDYKYIEFLKKCYPNSKFVYRFTNTITNYNRWSVERIQKVFDVIISMDKNDCAKYDWLYAHNSYRDDVNVDQYADPLYCSDVFFIGRDKGRLEQLLRVYDKLESNNIHCTFLVSNTDEKKKVHRKGIEYIRNLRYEEVIKYIANTRCVLEIVQEGQRGTSLRPLEAIAFNKRLLTNNKSIMEDDIYEERNMRIFEKESDIPISFIFRNIIYKCRDKIGINIFLKQLRDFLESM